MGYYQDYLLCWGSLKSDEQRLFVDWADLRRAYSAVTYVYVDERSKTPDVYKRQSFFPLALNNNVYRYGYMMPVHNAIDIYRVIFFDVSRRKMGRNYGILTALIALNTVLLPFVSKYAGKKLKQKALAAAKQG